MMEPNLITKAMALNNLAVAFWFNKLDLNVLYIDIKPKILLLYNTRLQMIS